MSTLICMNTVERFWHTLFLWGMLIKNSPLKKEFLLKRNEYDKDSFIIG